MKKILITGGMGYLGSKLSDYLQDLNFPCDVIDTGFFIRGNLYQTNYVKTKVLDVRKLKKTHLEGYDVLINLAGIANDPLSQISAEKVYEPTRKYSYNLASWCKDLGIKYIFPSSCSVYGDATGTSNEDSLTNPLTPYSKNKLQIEEDLSELADEKFSPIALRLATVFGGSPRIRFDIVINMLCGMAITNKKINLNSDGQAWRPHVHINDVCNAFRCCIDWEYKESKLMVLNVGHDENNLKILDVAKYICSLVTGCELSLPKNVFKEEIGLHGTKIHDGIDKRTYKVSFEKINNVLPGFSSKYKFKESVIDFINELKELKLDSKTFERRSFYRLQQLDYLHNCKLIDSDLYWL